MHEIKMIPIPGNKPSVIGSVEVNLNDGVEKDQVVFSIETAKGKRTIKSTVAGSVAEIKVQVGDEVSAGQVLMLIAAEEVDRSERIEENISPELEEKTADLAIIGGGPGGYVAAIYAAMNGQKVILIEKEKLGGTCLNWGCIPTKTLIESANLYKKLFELEELGLKADHISFDFGKVIQRKNNVVTTLNDGIAYLMKKHKIKTITGVAEFESNTAIKVKADKNYLISFENVIIATGAKQAEMKIEGLHNQGVMTSTQALDMAELPKSITIIGGGVIGMEFAFIYNSFGVEVKVIEFMEHILNGVDPEASEILLKIAKQRGMDFSLGSRVESIQKTDNNMLITSYRKEDKIHYRVSEKVLVAVGRVPNTDGLGMDKTDVKMKKGAVVVDTKMQTSVDHIYAIGDVTNIMQLAHVASHQGIVAVDHILGKKHEMDYHAVPGVIFTHPEIATVGVVPDENKHSIGRFDFSGNGKALVMKENEGFVKLVKDKESGVIVGATIIGPDASVMINPVTLAINQQMTEQALRQMIFPHPTTGEAVHEAAMDLGLGALHQ